MRLNNTAAIIASLGAAAAQGAANGSLGAKATNAVVAATVGSAIDATRAELTADIATAVAGVAAGGSPLTIVAAVSVSAGQPIYVDPTSGQIKLASAAAFAASMVAGLAQSATLATFAAPVATTTLMLSDWTAAIGAATLTKGARYFLGANPGAMSTVAPTVPGQSVVSIGLALSTTQLEISPTAPVLL
jgi:hypothetical protein